VQLLFSNALSEAVSKHIPLSATRLETLAWLTLLIMRQSTICLWRLAAHVATMARTESVRRRFYRFFQHVELDGAHQHCLYFRMEMTSSEREGVSWENFAGPTLPCRPR
jgi:hypothetical protein